MLQDYRLFHEIGLSQTRVGEPGFFCIRFLFLVAGPSLGRAGQFLNYELITHTSCGQLKKILRLFGESKYVYIFAS